LLFIMLDYIMLAHCFVRHFTIIHCASLLLIMLCYCSYFDVVCCSMLHYHLCFIATPVSLFLLF
jgi:hypothetical protein